jgi:hypothetical protein
MNNRGNSPKEDEGQDGSERPAPMKGIPDTNISIATLAHPCSTSVTLPPQLPERFARFILLAKVSNESTGVHP